MRVLLSCTSGFVGSLLWFGCGAKSGEAQVATDTPTIDSSVDSRALGLDSRWGPDSTTSIDARPPGDVDLGTAGTFAILAGSEITNTGYTIVTGDIGISPGSAITGFPPGVVMDGSIHSADAIAARAKSDLTTAYDNASHHSGAPVPTTGDLGGLTFTPGLYVSDASLEISSGDVTLDAGNNPSSVWVFQMATTFVAFSGRKVILLNGARGTNVFWQVGSSTVLGTYSEMAGNFLTETSISAQTGATVDGRVLTQTGAVTLDTNRIIRTIPIVIF